VEVELEGRFEGDVGWRFLVQGIADYAIFLLDTAGRVHAWNAGAELILGYAADDILGQHCSRFYVDGDADHDRPQRQLEVAAAEGRFEEEGWRVDSQGRRLWANVIVRPLLDDSGRLQGFTNVLRDLTLRRRAERLALLADRKRIADELNKRAIRVLFDIGLQLNGVANRIDDPDIGQRLDRCVQQLDEEIADLRRLAFDLGRSTD
jgi:PAS domain S-box-containing protein